MTLGLQIDRRLAEAPVVPLICSNDPHLAVQTVEALRDGGLSVVEVVMRCERSRQCMEAIHERVDGVTVGAGTVLNAEQARTLHGAGAQFIVSPGLDDAVARYCLDHNLPVYPGAVTAGEIQRAHALGLRTVKFFPAALAGGAPMIKALGAVFREMRFLPTGGITPHNLSDYLALDGVVACGGSWLTPADSIACGDFAAITRLARNALDTARKARCTIRDRAMSGGPDGHSDGPRGTVVA